MEKVRYFCLFVSSFQMVFLFIAWTLFYLIVGHSGINLVPIDPLHIPSIGIRQGAESPVNIELKFSEVDLIGLSGCRFTEIGLVFRCFYQQQQQKICFCYKFCV